MIPTGRHRVVVIGSGFGGLMAAKKLQRANVDVTLISRTTHHLFQPLLYQVATGILSEGEIAPATREILHRQRDVQVLLGDVEDIDLSARTVTSYVGTDRTVTPYDSLIVAAGAQTSYFGNDRFETYAPGLKSIDDALELRGRILSAFEFAELSATENDEQAAREWLTFVVVGAGATGVEMAGQIAELAHRTLKRDYRAISSRTARIVLVDAADAVLGNFGTRLAAGAAHQLQRLGVEVWLDEKVVDVDDRGITVEDSSGKRNRIETRTIVWAAGVRASALGATLANQSGADMDRSGRIAVRPDCTLPNHPEVFVIGDMMTLNNYPGVAQVAMQQASYAAKEIRRRLRGQAPQKPFVLLRQGEHGDCLALQGGSQRRAVPVRRVHRLGALARRSPAVPRRLQEPGHDDLPLGGELPRSWPFGAHAHQSPAVRANRFAAARAPHRGRSPACADHLCAEELRVIDHSADSVVHVLGTRRS